MNVLLIYETEAYLLIICLSEFSQQHRHTYTHSSSIIPTPAVIYLAKYKSTVAYAKMR